MVRHQNSLRAGVRIFDPAVTGDIEKGQDESNAVARRAARGWCAGSCAAALPAKKNSFACFSGIIFCR